MDNLERATLCVLNRKHQFIMQLGTAGRTGSEISEILALIDYEKEIEWATMCYDLCDKQAEAEAAAKQLAQAQSGS